jgi:hypothetical protein
MAELQIFVSSSMSELPDERDAVRRAVEKLQFKPFLYENDAHATTGSAQEQWEKVLSDSHICLVIVYRKLGVYTEGEIDFARNIKKQMLVYRKMDDAHVLEEDEERASFMAQLEDVREGVSVRYFSEAPELEDYVFDDLEALLTAVFEQLERFERGEVAGSRRQATGTSDGMAVREEARPGVVAIAPDEVRRIAEVRGPFVAREEDLADLIDSIESGERLIAVTGPYGIGRKTLVRHAVHTEDMGDFANGVGVGPADRGVSLLEDMLQAIWETFYEMADGADPVTVVDPRKRQADLEKLNALIVIEDGHLTESEFQELSDELRDSTVIVTTDGDWYGEEIPLEGLDDAAAMLTIWEQKARLEVPAEFREALTAVFPRFGGSPFLIEALAQNARKSLRRAKDDPVAWESWIGAIAGAESEELLEMLVPEPARAAFEAVMAVGTAVPLDALQRVHGDLDSAAAALVADAVQADSPRVRAVPALASMATRPDGEEQILDTMLGAAIEWAEAASDQEIFDNREFVVRMADWGAGSERWPEVIRLGRATEAAMAIGGRHGAWRRVLETVLLAARRSSPKDEAAEAWALHQLGSMALLRDELDDARELLHDALEKREDLGDTAGAALSRDNLVLVPMAIMSLAALILILAVLIGWLWAVSTPEAWAETWVPAGDCETPTCEPPPPSSTSTTSPLGSSLTIRGPAAVPAFPGDDAFVEFTVTNEGEIDVEDLQLGFTASNAYGVGDPRCAASTIDAAEVARCSFVVMLRGPLADDLTVPFDVSGQATDGTQLSTTGEVTILYPQRFVATLTPSVAQAETGGGVPLELIATSGANVVITDVSFFQTGDAVSEVNPACATDQEVAPGQPYICPVVVTVQGVEGERSTVEARIDFTFAGEPFSVVQGSASIEVVAQAASDLSLDIGGRLTGDADGDGFGDVGDVITFDYTLGNQGSAVLEDVELIAPLTGASSPVRILQPGTEVTTAATYTITAADLVAGLVRHEALVRATAPAGEVIASDAVTVPLSAASLEVTLTPQLSPDTVIYGLVIANDGNVPLTDITVADDLGASQTGCAVDRLAPGQSWTACKLSHVLTDAELAAATVENRFTVAATAPGGGRLVAVGSSVIELSVISVDVISAPPGEEFTVFIQAEEYAVSSSDPLTAAVARTTTPPPVDIGRFDIPDDWVLASGDCGLAGGLAGPVLGAFEADTTNPTTTCSFELVGQAIVEIDPDVLTFPPASFTISNIGVADVRIPDPDPVPGFTVNGGGCLGSDLTPGASCSVSVTAAVGATSEVLDFPFPPDVGGDDRVLLVP